MVFENILKLWKSLSLLGDSDAKVLTLAEHIIAAMPDRIKVSRLCDFVGDDLKRLFDLYKLPAVVTAR